MDRFHARMNTRTKSSYLLIATGRSKNRARPKAEGKRRSSAAGFLRYDFTVQIAERFRFLSLGMWRAKHFSRVTAYAASGFWFIQSSRFGVKLVLSDAVAVALGHGSHIADICPPRVNPSTGFITHLKKFSR
jgi:hypothetical protein